MRIYVCPSIRQTWEDAGSTLDGYFRWAISISQGKPKGARGTKSHHAPGSSPGSIVFWWAMEVMAH